uniref:ABI gene family member 3-like protein n=1 Tax=Castor canadensis TaxID=51338 RepID=A0A250XUT0_CASCN
MAELQQLQEFEIPTGREALRGNHSALLRVADYCENNYVQAADKRKALEETMAFTTQALASVAYQVGNLAGHTLHMLDLQGAALRQVEARVSTLGQVRGQGGIL